MKTLIAAAVIVLVGCVWLVIFSHNIHAHEGHWTPCATALVARNGPNQNEWASECEPGVFRFQDGSTQHGGWVAIGQAKRSPVKIIPSR